MTARNNEEDTKWPSFTNVREMAIVKENISLFIEGFYWPGGKLISWKWFVSLGNHQLGFQKDGLNDLEWALELWELLKMAWKHLAALASLGWWNQFQALGLANVPLGKEINWQPANTGEIKTWAWYLFLFPEWITFFFSAATAITTTIFYPCWRSGSLNIAIGAVCFSRETSSQKYRRKTDIRELDFAWKVAPYTRIDSVIYMEFIWN